MRSLMVTGGAGFIGSAFIREAIKKGYRIVVYDSLTYAGHLPNIESVLQEGVCEFVRGDICNFEDAHTALNKYSVEQVVNFAAESHVDNSIHGPKPFVQTNVVGTFNLLEAARIYWMTLPSAKKSVFRLLHVSTDEVFGELGDVGYFKEDTPYNPNSPYSATKAASDHLVRAWNHTYGLPVVVTNCSNNYGPRQFPEKLIPRMITLALRNELLPVYGKGENVRDWIHVEDHALGILLALEKGVEGETYCFGGRSERKNIEVVVSICRLLDELKPRNDNKKYSELISFVTDRAGHDWRYAIDDSKAELELGFTRKYKNFEDGLRQTIQWYLNNESWVQSVLEKN